MKRILYFLLAGFWSVNLPAQSISAAVTDEKEKAAKLSINGFVRGSVYGGADNYDLANTFAEIAFQPQFRSDKAFLKSDIRLRKGVFFDENKNLLIVKELYGGYRGEKFNLLTGYQIVEWGRTDGFNPTNNITPNDYFLLTVNPADQKLPNLMIRMKYRIQSDIELDVIGIPFYEASNYRYDLFNMGNNVTFSSNIFPEKKLRNGTVAARLNFDLPVAGWALSYFNGYDPYHGFDIKSVDWTSGTPILTNSSAFYRKTTLGADFAIPAGNLIFRGEAAYNITDNPDNKMYIPFSDFSYVAGVEWNFAGYMLITQYIGKYIPEHTDLILPTLSDPFSPIAQMQYANAMIDYENRMFNRRIFNQTHATNHAISVTLTKSFGYDAWNVECSGYYNFTTEEWMVHPKLSWKISDALSVSVGGNYMYGQTKTLFGYSSAVMNGAFAELRMKF
jgi:hypothetical protein